MSQLRWQRLEPFEKRELSARLHEIWWAQLLTSFFSLLYRGGGMANAQQ